MKVIRTMQKACYSINDLSEEEYRFIRSVLHMVSGEHYAGLHGRPDLQAQMVLARLPTVESFCTCSTEGKSAQEPK